MCINSCSTSTKKTNSFNNLESDKCFAGDASFCIDQGLREKDSNVSLKLFKKACELKSKVGCGLVYFVGDNTSKKAKDLFGQSCFLEKDKIGCGTLGFFALANGEEEKGYSLLKQACEMKHRYSCYQLLHGFIKQKNISEVTKYANKLCDLNDDETCLWLGNHYLGLKNKKDAKALFEKSCDLKNAIGCFKRGFNFIDLKNAKVTFAYLNKACELKHAKSCFYYADLLWETKKKLESFKYYQKSCNLKFSNGCVGLGRFYSDSGDKNLAIKYYSRGCEYSQNQNNNERKSDVLFNCFLAGQYSAEYFNPKISIDFFRRGCQFKAGNEEEQDFVMDSCARLGVYNYEADTFNKAVEYTKKRCLQNKNKKNASKNCYNLSCIYSLTRKIEESIAYMRKALEFGYSDWVNLKTDFETINIRNLPGFTRLVDEFQK